MLLATLPGPLCTLDADTRRRWVRTTGAEHSHDRSLRVLNASWVREWWTTGSLVRSMHWRKDHCVKVLLKAVITCLRPSGWRDR